MQKLKTDWGKMVKVGRFPGELEKAPKQCGEKFGNLVCRKRTSSHYCQPIADLCEVVCKSGFLNKDGEVSEADEWQMRVVKQFFATKTWDDDEGEWVQRYTRIWVQVPRQNGKSYLSKLIAAIKLMTTRNCLLGIGAQSKLAASDNIGSVILRGLREDPYLTTRTWRIRNNERAKDDVFGCEVRLLPATPGTLRGPSYDILLLDEILEVLHAAEWVAVGEGGQTSLLNTITICTTTCGDNPESYEAQQFEWYKAVVENPDLEPTTMTVLYYLPDGLDPWDEDNWPISNPGLGKIKKKSKMRQAAQEARGDPAKEAKFLREHHNRPMGEIINAIDREAWDACFGDFEGENEQERRRHLFDQLTQCIKVWAGVDMSYGNDLTSLVIIGQRADGVWLVWSVSFIDFVHFAAFNASVSGAPTRWARWGLLHIVKNADDFVEYCAIKIEEYLEQMNEVVEIGRDPAMSGKAADIWEKSGYKVRPIKQNSALDPGIKWVKSQALRTLQGQKSKMYHAGDPLLRYASQNTHTSVTLDGALEKIVKSVATKAGARIDPYIALCIAAYAMVVPEEEEEKVKTRIKGFGAEKRNAQSRDAKNMAKELERYYGQAS